MKSILLLLSATMLLNTTKSCAQESEYKNDNFKINEVSVTHKPDLGITIWVIAVHGTAGKTTPTKVGQLDGAPVLGYVFPTSLKPTDVGFNQTDGIVALALTSHPDFDDTPLWDENNDQIFDNDGIIWHPHWVILHEDKRVGGGLSVKQFKKADETVVLPPTNPGMPMYMDSPGYPVTTKSHTIKVVVPDYRMNNRIDFNYDGVTAFMKVNTSNESLPMLGVYEVYSVASGDLSLPYKVKN
ncbi:hypothetical protein [Maribacter hydrothermalis]|uniref:Uncharacterized protein n=1 Tax=Maribacter hydrothermalis TaxID=1836467 RepID=A0A1B7Z365_9FLAO|nr:hypothetical protein [Maribacter hydrothermalis]APQ16916.1 hypothetical protein BTR34_06090 [Maribacter hydrothermalis]OBR37177.1 hypothetical protein A9200_05850 [Maribacter hydrothermalis]